MCIRDRVNPKAGLTFASGLRSILRQDPDTIMIGEIRDAETAEIAVRAAITGHLVLSTLHTNDSPSTVARLIDMGLEPYLVSSAIIGIISPVSYTHLDQYVRVKIEVPKKLTEKQRNILVQFANEMGEKPDDKKGFFGKMKDAFRD